MSSVLRPVRKCKKGRTLGPVEIIRREDYADLEVDAKVELIRSLVPLGLMHVEELLDEELTALAGERYARKAASVGGVGAGLHGFGLSEDADPLASSTAAGAQFPREFEGAPEVQDEISRRKLAGVRTSPRGARRRDTLALRRRDGRVETCAVWSAGRAEEILGPRDRDRIDAPARLPVALAPDRGLLAVGPGLDAPRPRSARSHHALAAESASRSRSRSHSGPGASSSHRRQHGPVDRRRGRMGRGETRGTRQARLEEAPSRCRPIRRDRCPSADRADGR